MDFQSICTAIKEIGVPAVILLWILTIGAKNQIAMNGTLSGIQKELAALSVTVHDADFYIKQNGGK